MTLAELIKRTGVKVERIDDDNFQFTISAVAAKQKHQRGHNKWCLIVKDVIIAAGEDLHALVKQLRIEDYNIRYNIKRKRKRKK